MLHDKFEFLPKRSCSTKMTPAWHAVALLLTSIVIFALDANANGLSESDGVIPKAEVPNHRDVIAETGERRSVQASPVTPASAPSPSALPESYEYVMNLTNVAGTQAKGAVKILFLYNYTEVVVYVYNINDIIDAGIYKGGVGKNGPLVYSFFTSGHTNKCYMSVYKDDFTVGLADTSNFIAKIVANPSGYHVKIASPDFPMGVLRAQVGTTYTWTGQDTYIANKTADDLFDSYLIPSPPPGPFSFSKINMPSRMGVTVWVAMAMFAFVFLFR